MRRFLCVLLAWSSSRVALADMCEYPIESECAQPTPRADFVPSTNGCGPSSRLAEAFSTDEDSASVLEELKNAASAALVPNTYPEKADFVTRAFYGSADFLDACNGHDVCYGTCGSNQNTCDATLRDAMLVACQKAFPNDSDSGVVQHLHQNCRWRANFYRAALAAHGAGPHSTAQSQACECCRDDAPSAPGDARVEEPFAVSDAGPSGVDAGVTGADAGPSPDDNGSQLINSMLTNLVLLRNGDVYVYLQRKVIANVSAPLKGVPTEGFVTVLRKDGTVVNVVQGSNNAPVVRELPNLSDIKKIASGFYFRCGIRGDGRVRCWDDKGIDFVVPDVEHAAQISVGAFHSCALLETGQVKCWGRNGGGELGAPPTSGWNGNTHLNPASVPVLVPGLSDAIEVATGMSASCAVLRTGKVKCWGTGFDLAAYGFTSSHTPVEIKGVEGARGIRIPAESAHLNFKCALLEDRTAKCWGLGYFGSAQIPTNSYVAPTVLPGLTGILDLQISATAADVCALLSDETVKCWGSRNTVPTVYYDAIP